MAWVAPVVETTPTPDPKTESLQTEKAQREPQSRIDDLLRDAGDESRAFVELAALWGKSKGVSTRITDKTEVFSANATTLFVVYPRDDAVGFYLGSLGQDDANLLHEQMSALSSKLLTTVEPYMRCADLVADSDKTKTLLDRYLAAHLGEPA